MSFIIISLIALATLGGIAAIFSIGSKDDEPIQLGEGDCASCSSHSDGSCKLACLMDEKKKREAAVQ